MVERGRCLPVSLTVVGLLWVFDGSMAAWGMLRGLFGGSFTVNLGVLFVPVGLGLLALRPAWRTAALAFTWFALAVWTVLAVAFFLSRPVDLSMVDMPLDLVPLWVPAWLVVVPFLILVWQLYVLCRADVARLFAGGEPRPLGPATRALAVVVVAAAGGVTLVEGPLAERLRLEPKESIQWATEADGTLTLVGAYWGEQGGRLAYVVFRRSPGVSRHAGTDSTDMTWLHEAAGHRVRLPGRQQLHEVIDGRYRSDDRRVTLSQFRALLESGTEDLTIEALLASVAERPPSSD
jgi:hypothetical protein